MRWIDGHLDLAYLAVGGRDLRQSAVDRARGCITLPAMREAGIELAFGTIFTEPGVFGRDHPHGYPSSDDFDAAEAAGMAQLTIYEQWEREGEISLVRSQADLAATSKSKSLTANGNALPQIMLLMENADPIRSPDAVGEWFQRGLRMVGLTWATGSRYSGGNGDGGPLKPLGPEMVKALDAVGIIHDVSHLSDAAFEAVMEISRGPIAASHSNARGLLEPKQRHLKDEHIKAIAGRNGIVGLNLYSAFLATGRRATIDDAVRHVNHVADLMGHRRGVGLGSDMDGGFTPRDLPIGLDHPRQLGTLAAALRNSGWSEAEVEGFAWGNWLRFLTGAFVSS